MVKCEEIQVARFPFVAFSNERKSYRVDRRRNVNVMRLARNLDDPMIDGNRLSTSVLVGEDEQFAVIVVVEESHERGTTRLKTTPS